MGGAAKNDTRRSDIFGAITVERRLCETTFNVGDDAFSLSHGEDDSLSLSYREDESQHVEKACDTWKVSYRYIGHAHG